MRELGSPAWAKDPKFATMSDRKKNEDALDKHIGEWARWFEFYRRTTVAYCANCGQPLSDGAFCTSCGRSVAPPPRPASTEPVSDKSRVAAGVLGIVLGGLGVHSFYLGQVGKGIGQIAVSVFTCGIGVLWGFIEGIIILADGKWRDGMGRLLRKHGE